MYQNRDSFLLYVSYFHSVAEGRLSSVLKEVALPILSDDIMDEWYPDFGNTPPEYLLVGYEEGKRDTCQVCFISGIILLG